MKFDINGVIKEMLGVVQQTVSEKKDEVNSIAKQFFERKKKRLELLAELRFKGELNQEKFESRLKDEQLILEAELQALAVLGKAIAQKAANAAFDIFQKAVSTALGTVI